MPFTQHIFIRSDYLGTVQRGYKRVHEQLITPESVAYFCPKCGEIWARLATQGCDTWCVITRNCEKHNGGFLSCVYASGFIFGANGEALRREFLAASAEPLNYFCSACPTPDIYG